MVLSFLIVISFQGARSAMSLISPLGLNLGNMLTWLLAWQGEMIFFAFQSLMICLYAGRILSISVNIFGLGAVFPFMRLRWWLICCKGGISVISLAGKTSGN